MMLMPIILELKSTVNICDTTENTISTTSSFPMVESLEGAVVICADVTEVPSTFTLFILSKDINLFGMTTWIGQF